MGLPFVPRLAWTFIFHLCFLYSWDDSHMPPSTGFIVWDGVSITFCQGWPWNSIIQLSTSQVARITDVRHHSEFFLMIYFIHKWSHTTPLKLLFCLVVLLKELFILVHVDILNSLKLEK
jgi:hypothetical protein